MNTSATDGRDDTVGQVPHRRSWVQSVAVVALWFVVLALLAVAVLRIAWHDGFKLLIWFNAYTFYLYLPAYGVAALAAWLRRWRLAAAATFVVLCHLVWIAPDFTPAARLETASPESQSPVLRIFFANASMFNADYRPLIEEVERADPDVIAFAEFTPRLQYELQKSLFMRRYEYGTQLFEPFPGEVVVFSRVPTARARPVWVAERPYIPIDIPIGDSELRLVALHSPRPMKFPWQDYHGFWRGVQPAIAAQPRPLVVVGDFNATQHSLVYKQLLAMGLRSAHVDRGRGYAATWPNGRLPLPPIRIDQALLSPEVECLKIVEGIGAGSDHRPLIFEVRLRPSASVQQQPKQQFAEEANES